MGGPSSRNTVFYSRSYPRVLSFVPVLEIFVMGIIFAYCYERTGSLPAVVIAHALNNAIALLIAP
jgi:membrane protease YdiL (CAAX protease family)